MDPKSVEGKEVRNVYSQALRRSEHSGRKGEGPQMSFTVPWSLILCLTLADAQGAGLSSVLWGAGRIHSSDKPLWTSSQWQITFSQMLCLWGPWLWASGLLRNRQRHNSVWVVFRQQVKTLLLFENTLGNKDFLSAFSCFYQGLPATWHHPPDPHGNGNLFPTVPAPLYHIFSLDGWSYRETGPSFCFSSPIIE